jgi:ATP-dependent DNA ligase
VQVNGYFERLRRRFSPMLASPASRLPVGEEVVFEPKWDGTRTLLRVVGDGR